MENFRAPARIVAGVALLALGSAVPPPALAGGTLHYATVGEPPSLDQQVVTSDLATTIAHHIFEGLYTFDANYEPRPLLASGEEVSDDGKIITIHLRQGVKFHDGQAMTSADVVASLKRWGEHGSRGKLLFSNVSEVSAPDEYSVKLTFNSTFGPWKNLMAFINGGPAIYPATVASTAGKAPIDVKDYIGTGPYMFGEWKPNRHLELVRFDGYNGPAGDASGYAGRRAAHFDRLRFIPVPDPGTRINGLRAGDYDYAESVPSDLFDELDMDPAVNVVLNGGPIFGLVFMNSKAGPLQSNFKLRQAIQAALNKEDALRVSIGPEKLWRANGSFLPKGNVWYSDSGTDRFSEGNAEKAGALARAARAPHLLAGLHCAGALPCAAWRLRIRSGAACGAILPDFAVCSTARHLKVSRASGRSPTGSVWRSICATAAAGGSAQAAARRWACCRHRATSRCLRPDIPAPGDMGRGCSRTQWHRPAMCRARSGRCASWRWCGSRATRSAWCGTP